MSSNVASIFHGKGNKHLPPAIEGRDGVKGVRVVRIVLNGTVMYGTVRHRYRTVRYGTLTVRYLTVPNRKPRNLGTPRSGSYLGKGVRRGAPRKKAL